MGTLHVVVFAVVLWIFLILSRLWVCFGCFWGVLVVVRWCGVVFLGFGVLFLGFGGGLARVVLHSWQTRRMVRHGEGSMT